uniref:Meiosis regulator and mRNA stability factor 1-like n=1 Tax=Dermatophagoides pteronyssinus TaxID=6956 RepID=A0A6P6YHH8_DERPT|nr:meiosis regulator and mRNA stability factor 1-like [Dermatophagoides pteronyssinus]
MVRNSRLFSKQQQQLVSVNKHDHRPSIINWFQQTNSNQIISSTMNQSDNQFNAHVNVNLNNQYWLQQQFNINPRKPVGVFWDIENCTIPRGVSPSYLVEKIRLFIQSLYMIEREFAIVCDVPSFTTSIINELNNSQVNIIHISSFAKNAADEKLKQLILRFVQTNGPNCAVILFSSDINFVPVLSDIKNRIGVFVILFHHHLVSSALLASSHYHFDYDQFCLTPPNVNVPSNNYKIMKNQSDFIMTSLRISNLPSVSDEEQTKSLLNRIINNNGGRIIYLDMMNHEAIVRFKCRSDALRCHQRVDNRKFYGYILRSKFEPAFTSNHVQSYNQDAINNHDTNQINQINANHIDTDDRINEASQPSFISQSLIERATKCKVCTVQIHKQSKNHNFLFTDKIFSINIDFDNFCRKLSYLLLLHDGELPLNALPDCWLKTFESELDDSNNDGPKVMLEHLITCIPNVNVRDLEIEIDQNKILTKFIVNESLDESSYEESENLKNFMINLQLLLDNQISNEIKGFPSIELNELETEYYHHFGHNINPFDYGCSNLIELLQSCRIKFNIYSYGNHRIIALNFEEQAYQFILEFAKLYPFDLTDPNYFDNFNIAVYGACSIEDMIAAIDMRTDLVEQIRDKNQRLAIFSYPKLVHNSTILDEFDTIKADLKQTLLLMPDFSMDLSKFHEDFSQLIYKKLNITITYCRLSNLIINHSDGDFEIMVNHLSTLPCPDKLMLSIDLQLQELGKRFVKIFNEMATIIFGKSCHTNEKNIAIPIYDLIYHYHRRYKSICLENLAIKSMPKLFEKILANSFLCYENYCLIYTTSSIFLKQFSSTWLQCILHFILRITIQYRSFDRMITFDEFRQLFHDHFGFSFGLSFFFNLYILKMIRIVKYVNNDDLIVELEPSCEFVAKCLIVMLLHKNIVFPNQHDHHHHQSWTLEQIENEFYDHFGVSLAYSNPNGNHQFNPIELFTSFDWLFEIEDYFHYQTIKIKEIDSFDYDLNNIPRCNYCEYYQEPQHHQLPTTTAMSEEMMKKNFNQQSSIMMQNTGIEISN